MPYNTADTVRPVALASAGLLLGAALAMALAAPASADLPTTGAWIFPHERQEKVLSGELGEFYYNTSSSSEWIADAFFADSESDGADFDVDLYNPTAGDLDNVILWVAVSDNELFSSISFNGGESGNITVLADDLGGGTPTTNAPLPDFVYPAHFASYGIGTLAAGDAGIVTATINVVGDFAGGLVVRLDYTATDASGNDVSGPFAAGMSIYEWGDLPDEVEMCPVDGGLKLQGSISGKYENGLIDFDASLTLIPDFQYTADNVVVALSPGPGLVITNLPGGEVVEGVGTVKIQGNVSDNQTLAGITLRGSPLLIDGDAVFATFSVMWDGCDGGGAESTTVGSEVNVVPTGDVESASYWARDLKDSLKDEGRGSQWADRTTDEYSTLMQSIALHSMVFTYGPWDGEDPFGGDDEGWVDISDLEDARDILRKAGRGNGREKEAEQELLALWLNIAAGHITLDSAVAFAPRGDHGDDDDDDDHDEGDHGRNHLDLPDTVGAIVAHAESALGDFYEAGNDGSGNRWWRNQPGLGRALLAAAVLCWLVNSGWLQAA